MHTLLGVCICIVGGAFILSTSYTVGSFISVLHIESDLVLYSRVVLSRNIHRTSCTTVQASTWIWGLSSEDMKFTSKTVYLNQYPHHSRE